MPEPLTHTSPIIVIGGGTWGASTALHLSRRGYKAVTVLDAHAYPSPISAGNDVNKIVETVSGKDATSADGESEAGVERTLLRAASAGWLRDPVFMEHYHETGYVVAASSADGLAFVRERELAGDVGEWTRLETAEDFRRTMPDGVLTGEFAGWKGWAKKSGMGWAHARNAYMSAAKEAERLGVKFVGGQPGEVVEIVVEEGDVVGARTRDGVLHRAARTILAAGAYSNELLDFKAQLRPTAWTLLHLRMSAAEMETYKDLPVLFNVESGFFMEPDAERHELKICDEHPGYTNFHPASPGGDATHSIPFARHQVPADSERRARAFLRDTMPHLASRPFAFARICWCADTPDRVFLIDTHPEWKSLVLGVGGSGHGYAHIPSVGGFVVDAMEGKLVPLLKEAFRWRPETAVGRDWRDVQGRFGGERRVMDFGDVKEWTTIEDDREF